MILVQVRRATTKQTTHLYLSITYFKSSQSLWNRLGDNNQIILDPAYMFQRIQDPVQGRSIAMRGFPMVKVRSLWELFWMFQS